MPTKQELSEIRQKAAQKARTHGIQAFERQGPNALDEDKRAYLRELQLKVSTQPGRMEIRQELTAAVKMIVDLGFSHLQNEAKDTGNIWESGIIKRLATYINCLRLLLDNWPMDNSEIDAATVLYEIRKDRGDDQENNERTD